MKHATAWLAALALTLPLSLQAGDKTMTQTNNLTPDQIAVHSAVTEMTEAFQEGRIARVMDSYLPGAAVAFEPGQPVADPDQMAAMFNGMAGLKPVFTYSGHEVIVSGDTALHIAPWTMTGTGPDGAPMEQTGLSVAVLHRQADGSWRMSIDNPHGAHLMQ